MEHSLIPWTDHTHNIVIGCVEDGPECARCYARDTAHRYEKNWGIGAVWGPARNTPRKTLSDAYWRQPLRWEREVAASGERKRVFCGSMCDVCEDHPTTNQERQRLFPLIAATPHLDWLLLTKRPQNFLPFFQNTWGTEAWPTNVWTGTSVGLQASFERRYDDLLTLPSICTFLSIEPLIGAVDVRPFFKRKPPKWVIVGGESDRSLKSPARPMHLEWVYAIKQACEEYGIAFYMKQMGSMWAREQGIAHIDPKGEKMMDLWPTDLRIREFPNLHIA